MDNTNLTALRIEALNKSLGDPLVPIHADGFLMFAFLFCIFLATLGLFGNAVLFFIIIRSEKLRLNLTYLFVLNLCFIDIVASFAVLPFSALGVYNGYWIFSAEACQGNGFISTFCKLGSIMAICAISVERFYIIRLPMEYAANMTVQRAALILSYVWFQSIVLAVLPVLGWNCYEYIPSLGHCSYSLTLTKNDRLYVLTLFFFGFIIPGTVILSMYCGIYKVAHDVAVRVQPTNSRSHERSSNSENHGGQIEQTSNFDLDQETSTYRSDTISSECSFKKSTKINIISSNFAQTSWAKPPILNHSEKTKKDLTKTKQSSVTSDDYRQNKIENRDNSLPEIFAQDQQVSLVKRPSKAMKTLVIILLTYLVFWGPYFTLTLLSFFEIDISSETQMVTTLLAYSSFAFNPLIYGWMNRTIREELFEFLQSCCHIYCAQPSLDADTPGQHEDFFEFLERTSTTRAHSNPINGQERGDVRQY